MEPRKSSCQCGLKAASGPRAVKRKIDLPARKRSLMRGAGRESVGIAPGCRLGCKRRLFEYSQGRARSIVGTEIPGATEPLKIEGRPAGSRTVLGSGKRCTSRIHLRHT